MEYSNKQLIILMAGKASRLYPLTFGFPKGLLSIKQKPAIYNMMLPLINKGLRDIILVVNEENKSLIEDFMTDSFSNLKLNVSYVIQKDFSGPGKAFELTKDHIKNNKGVILLLSDTLCKYPSNFDNSWIGVKKVSDDIKENYCIIGDKDNKIISIIDKPKCKTEYNNAAIGLYYFKDSVLLKDVLNKKIEKIKNEYQLSSYFNEYIKKEDMYIENIDDWEDIGTLENYMKANKNNFNCRAFNNLYLDDFGVLCKKSKYSKVTSEMNWFKNIENTGFESLSPKFYESYKSDDEYGVEFYDYLTLSEYLTYYPLKDENRKYIFKMLLNKLIPIYKTKVSSNIDFENLLLEMLITKTRNRLNKWNRKDLINSKYININGTTYKGILNLLIELDPYIKDICRSSNNYISIIHGDPAFSNILFSPRNMLFKFIDPRGNFGIDTVYGDYRYDIAKLRHCYHGRYDEIVNDLYVVNESKENDIFNISLKYYKNVDYSIYDEIILEHNLNLDDVELIEGLLFISMIPLHDDYPERQIAFFARGIEILNNQLKRREKVC